MPGVMICKLFNFEVENFFCWWIVFGFGNELTALPWPSAMVIRQLIDGG